MSVSNEQTGKDYLAGGLEDKDTAFSDVFKILVDPLDLPPVDQSNLFDVLKELTGSDCELLHYVWLDDLSELELQSELVTKLSVITALQTNPYMPIRDWIFETFDGLFSHFIDNFKQMGFKTVKDVRKMSMQELRHLFRENKRDIEFEFDVDAVWKALSPEKLTDLSVEIVKDGPFEFGSQVIFDLHALSNALKTLNLTDEAENNLHPLYRQTLMNIAAANRVEVRSRTKWPMEKVCDFQTQCMKLARFLSVQESLARKAQQANAEIQRRQPKQH
jgi:hypothetical protein